MRRWSLPRPRRVLATTVLLSGLLAASAGSQTRDPSLAPPIEELERQADEWKQRRRVGAALLWGSLVAASVIIGWVRHRQRSSRQAPGGSDPVDKSPGGRPP